MPTFGLQPAGLLQTIFEEIGVAVAVIDRDGKLAFANRTASDLLDVKGADGPIDFPQWRTGYKFEDSLGHEIALYDSVIMRALRGERIESQEIKAKFPDGTTRWLLAWAYPFSVVGLAGVLALVVDETMEVELRRAASQLQRMETLGALAAGLTHNLNNILDTIVLNAKLAADESGKTEKIQGRLDQVSAASLKAANLVKRLMQFSRSETLEYGPVDVNEMVKEALHLIEPLLRPDVVVKINLQDGLALIRGDILQLEQAVINLIVNALDAMPNGGELSLSTASEAAGVANNNSKQERVCFTVADTGVGIAEELQSMVFEPFFTTKPAGKGTGLGLSSTYGIVRQHQGEVKLRSIVGSGSAFMISLPAWHPARSEQAVSVRSKRPA